jgi:hypothetical protein
MTALSCLQRGLKVTIYSDRIPKPNELNAGLLSTSEMAPGYWFPHIYEYSDYKVHQERSLYSYNKYL